MPNKNYIKGRRKEYKIRQQLIEEGYLIVQRTAGSHSAIDIIAIDPDDRRILFVQAKPDSMVEKNKKALEKEHCYLNGSFYCTFEVR